MSENRKNNHETGKGDAVGTFANNFCGSGLWVLHDGIDHLFKNKR